MLYSRNLALASSLSHAFYMSLLITNSLTQIYSLPTLLSFASKNSLENG